MYQGRKVPVPSTLTKKGTEQQVSKELNSGFRQGLIQSVAVVCEGN